MDLAWFHLNQYSTYFKFILKVILVTVSKTIYCEDIKLAFSYRAVVNISSHQIQC